ncbi:MAG: ABC transporter substrate-binding protein [Paracoccaceae bacterium]
MALAVAILPFAGLLAGAAPARVVSMNVCTDQLAMLIAAPGQLLSVSWLAADPRLSSMAAAAGAIRLNRGDAEDIFLMHPDVVLADEWSDAATVDMLRRLGLRVEEFDPGTSMTTIRGNITRMGAILGREAAAAEVLAGFGARMAALPPVPAMPPRAAVYGPNGWTEGPASLAGQILDAAGYQNVAAGLGYGIGGTLPLEVLVMTSPDLVITGERAAGAARADEVLSHPALAGFTDAALASDAAWVCPGPFVADAVERLAAARLAGEGP